MTPTPPVSSAASRASRTTYRLDLEYEGTRYRGWQIQENATSVAGCLVRAFEAAGLPLAELGGAGRTDAGVHALHQVAHARLLQRVDPQRLHYALADNLPHDIAIQRVREASSRFHARHDATSRSYIYQLARRRTAFGKRLVWWVRDDLDAGQMAQAAKAFEGRHDFARFCAQPGQQESTIVHVERCTIVEEGGLILVRIEASHFLWKMVRRVVGVLVEVGTGRVEPTEIPEILAGRALDPAKVTAPPSGLFLEKVRYAGDPPLSPPHGLISVSAC